MKTLTEGLHCSSVEWPKQTMRVNYVVHPSYLSLQEVSADPDDGGVAGDSSWFELETFPPPQMQQASLAVKPKFADPSPYV